MKTLLIALTVCGVLMSGCTPSDQPTPVVEPTPTAAAGDKITDMDFESGDADQPTIESEEPAPEPTPKPE